jgi:hypothetical protein
MSVSWPLTAWARTALARDYPREFVLGTRCSRC